MNPPRLACALCRARPLTAQRAVYTLARSEVAMFREPSRLPPVQVFTANAFPDERGFLLQSWVQHDLAARGIPSTFKQAIQTWSHRGVVRGLHFQWDPPMGKLVLPARRDPRRGGRCAPGLAHAR